jgi:hypothetical protein
MRKTFAFFILAIAAGCASNQQSDQKTLTGDGKIPSDVQAAFFSEHPYAKIDDASQQSSPQDGTLFTVDYTRSDGSKGVAVFTSMGVLRSDN